MTILGTDRELTGPRLRPGGDDRSGRRQGSSRARGWRRRAWQLRGAGRPRAAVDLQRALVALRGGSTLVRLRDRFRLLRWQIEDGLWLEALETIDQLCGQLAARGAFGGSAAGWIFLARAVCHFHLGDGVRFRRSLALVLRTAWRGRWTKLLSSALWVRAAELRLLRGPAAPVSAAEQRALAWSRGRDEIAAGRGRPPRADQPAAGSWGRLTWSLEGPPRWRSPDHGKRERLLQR